MHQMARNAHWAIIQGSRSNSNFVSPRSTSDSEISMYRSPDQYNHWSPYSPPDQGFRPPQQRFPNSPRFHQQFVPHHSGSPGQGINPGQGGGSGPSPYSSPYTSSPRADRDIPPFRNSPYTSPQHQFESRGRKRGYNNRNITPRGRWQGGNSPRQFNDSNPGASSDITQYYHPSIVQDPWEGMKPVPVSQPSFTST